MRGRGVRTVVQNSGIIRQGGSEMGGVIGKGPKQTDHLHVSFKAEPLVPVRDGGDAGWCHVSDGGPRAASVVLACGRKGGVGQQLRPEAGHRLELRSSPWAKVRVRVRLRLAFCVEGIGFGVHRLRPVWHRHVGGVSEPRDGLARKQHVFGDDATRHAAHAHASGHTHLPLLGRRCNARNLGGGKPLFPS